MKNVKISTKTGTYLGKTADGIREFLGIRYVKPVDFWEFPKPLETTAEDIIEAFEYGPACLQPTAPEEISSQGTTQNDCLTLNIWTKDNDNKKKPVMFYIHGGAYVNGGNNDHCTTGKGLLKLLPEVEDAVMVKINYRLGIFGCADLSVLDDYTDEYEHSLALFMADQIAALKWVNENISSFGGDPDNVTLFGQSAGSMSIAYLMANAEARQYFRRGIMQSGIPGFGLASREAKANAAKAMFDYIGVKTIKELKALGDDYWKANYDKIFGKHAGAICPRVLDGVYITEAFWQDIVDGKAKDIDLMIGAGTGELDFYKYNPMKPTELNTAEGIMAILCSLYEDSGVEIGQLCPFGNEDMLMEYINEGTDEEERLFRAINCFNAISATMGAYYYSDAQSKWNKTYSYAWNWMPDATPLDPDGVPIKFSDWGRALHCAELPVLFGTQEVAYPTYSKWWLFKIRDKISMDGGKGMVPVELSQKTALTWYSFAKTGDPNNELIPKWVPYNEEDQNFMFMDLDWKMKNNGLFKDSKRFYCIQPIKERNSNLRNKMKRSFNIHGGE